MENSPTGPPTAFLRVWHNFDNHICISKKIIF
jgi:hypothetical protein